MQPPIPPPRTEELLAPLLASLPAASISPSPPDALLPSLSPILRQRVQLLSSTSQEPWLPLLCYDAEKPKKLEAVVKNERFEPHPVSGEVEVDWEYDVSAKYKRLDEETLQCLITLPDFGLAVRLIWCVNDEVGGGDGWRIGEVTPSDPGQDEHWGEKSIGFAEEAFKTRANQQLASFNRANGTNPLLTPAREQDGGDEEDDDDDDDDYWAQYDNTPARTPAPQHSPAPRSGLGGGASAGGDRTTDEDTYYAQYATVQPAMDNHDPDEAQQSRDIESSLGKDEIASELQQRFSSTSASLQPAHSTDLQASQNPWSDNISANHGEDWPTDYRAVTEGIAHPRPGSSTGSSGSDTVARLEKRAAAHEQSEVGIKQHIGTSVKSLYRLARASGIERSEFDRLVRTELDCLGLMDEDE